MARPAICDCRSLDDRLLIECCRTDTYSSSVGASSEHARYFRVPLRSHCIASSQVENTATILRLSDSVWNIRPRPYSALAALPQIATAANTGSKVAQSRTSALEASRTASVK
jgi:hypothetical protein